MTNHKHRKGCARSCARTNFLHSDAPNHTKAEARAILNELDPHIGPLDKAELSARAPELMVRISAFSCVGLDFFRVLRNEEPALGTHRRNHVSASLRHTRSKHDGRAPMASDYPAGHVVPVLVWLYFGSFEAWGRGAPARAQRPKGHWRQKANQIAALRDVALRFPGEPLTHVLLGRAGHHGLAKALSGAQIAILATEIGLDRHLAHRPDGWWTADRCMDRYAELCRERNATLSSHALAGMGGEGCTIRAQAAGHFDTFAAFQAAAALRHHDLRLPKRPVTRCGVLMESWGEALTFDAIRRAMPDVRIEVHVRLPERRSCDLVLNGCLYVEILGMALAAMAAPRNQYEDTYAARWTAKAALYNRLGIVPFTIEPADVNDPVRMEARIGEIATRVGVEPQPLPPSTRGTLRANGTWSFAFLCQVVTHVADEIGGLFPTHAMLTARNYGYAAQLLKNPDTAQKVSAATGIPLRNRKKSWTDERVIAAHVTWVQSHDGRYPTMAELQAKGQLELASARLRLFNRRQDVLRTEVGRRCGLELPSPQMPRGSYDTRDKIAALLRPLCAHLGRFPTGAEMNAALPGTIYPLVSTRWGMRAMAAFMQVPYEGPRAWTKEAVLVEFRAKLPRLPQLGGGTRLVITCTAISQTMGSTGLGLMQRFFGNIAGLRAALSAEDKDERKAA